MPITYTPIQTLQGFDPLATPKWQMVPVGGIRTLTVSGHGSLLPRVTPTGLVTATLSRAGRLTITAGRTAGHGFIEWVPSMTHTGTVAASNKLEISVKARKRVRTAFHYVSDNSGHTTARSQSDLNSLIAGVNAILTSQANVAIFKKSAQTITVPQNLGSVVRFVGSRLRRAPHNVPIAEHEWDDLQAYLDPSADFNVFFVWEYEQDATPNLDNANAATLASRKMCVLEDETISSSRTLAHEAVHLLGIRGHIRSSHSSGATNLMTAASRARRNLTRAQANTINPSGT